MADKKYSLQRDSKKIILKTASFKAEKGSVLHSGIYSRELSSTFVAAGVSLAYIFIIAISSHLDWIHYILSSLFFVIIFPLSRTYIFKETYFETIMDKDSERITITHKKLLGSETIQKPISALKDIKTSHIKIEPENPDGVAFVEKIALQHGTVIPGFGQTEHFYTVELIFSDESIPIFSSNASEESESITSTLKAFITD